MPTIAVCLILIAGYGAVASRSANAATIIVNPPDAFGRTFVDVIGDLEVGDDANFEAQVGIPADPEKVIVTLMSNGGNPVAIGIGDLIRLTGMRAFVPDGETCASACAFVWLAGSQRFVGTGARIGFHGIYDAQTGQQPAIPNALIATYLGYLGISYEAVLWMLSPRQLAIHLLTAESAKQFGISWQRLDPPRTVPLPSSRPSRVAPQNPSPQPSTSSSLYLNCTPTVIASELDPITSISVGLIWQGSQVSYFDAWHHSMKGSTYKRSEQYGDRRFEIPNVQEANWLWEGRWNKDRNVYMIGQLAQAIRAYTYREWLVRGDPVLSREEVTSSVCTEVRQMADFGQAHGP
jgi:hypothetical protein